MSSALMAQTSDPAADISRQTDRLQERAQEDFERRAEDFEAEQRVAPEGSVDTPPTTEIEEGGECVAIETVELKGMTLFEQNDFSDSISEVTGPCVTLAKINILLRAITNKYIERGYVTSRAVVAPQDMSDGSLEIIVFEGQLTEVKAGEGLIGKSELAVAMPGMEGGTLNLRDIEQGIDQISRLPSLDPKMDIEPGKAQATSNVVVKTKKKASWLRPSVVFDNEGQPSTGQQQTSLAIQADNIFGLLDSWGGYYSTDLTGRSGNGFESYGGFFSIPYGYWTLSLGGGRNQYETSFQGRVGTFVSDGDSWNASAGVERLFYRDSNTKISTAFGLNISDSLNRIQGIRISVSSYRLVTGRVEFVLQQRLGKGLLQASAGLNRGLNILGAESADFGPDGPNVKFRKLVSSVSYQQPLEIFGVKTKYSVRLRGQSTLDPVLPAQRFSLGGSGTVRGFRDQGLSGRSGMFFRQQIQTDLLSAPFSKSNQKPVKLSAFTAYDAGGIFPHADDPFERGFIHSSVTGILLQSPYFNAEASVAVPLSAPDFVRHNKLEWTFRVKFGL